MGYKAYPTLRLPGTKGPAMGDRFSRRVAGCWADMCTQREVPRPATSVRLQRVFPNSCGIYYFLPTYFRREKLSTVIGLANNLCPYDSLEEQINLSTEVLTKAIAFCYWNCPEVGRLAINSCEIICEAKLSACSPWCWIHAIEL